MPSEASEHDKKQNGSVNDDESKARTRVSRACTRCRARKDRCDGQRPSCSACRNVQAVCCYEPATKKRGLPEGYVRGLEKLLALLIGKIDGFEDTASNLMHEHRSDLLKIWNHATIGEELHTTWKESKIIQELENLLGGLDQSTSTGHKRKRERDDEDEDDAEDELDATFHNTAQYMVSRNGEMNHMTSGLSMSIRQPVTEVKLPSNAIALVDHYFAHVHCWFPIVDRPQVLRACYELSRGKAQPTTDEATRALLWAIFAYTSKLKRQGERHTFHPDVDQNLDTEQYRTAAWSKIPDDAQLHNRMHAQAFLILALLDIGLGKWKSAWASVGHAIRVVLCETAQAKVSKSNDSALFQGCAVLDIAIASHFGGIPHLRRADFEFRNMMSEDGYEEWEPWTAPGIDQNRHREPSFATSSFNRLTEVLLVDADALALSSQQDKVDRTYAQSLLARLHQLQSTFPGHIPPSIQSPPHQVYLQIAHISAQMKLIDVSGDTGVGVQDRAKLACNVLGLLELCKNAKVIGLEHVPPFVGDCIELACKLARSSAASFGMAAGLPSFHEFNRTASELVSSMADTWPVYSHISSQQRQSSQPQSYTDTPTSRTNAMISPNALSSPSASELTAQKRLRGSVGTSQRQDSTPLTSHPTYSSENISLPDLNNWQYPGTNQTSYSMPNLNIIQFSSTVPAAASNEPNMGSMGSIVGLDMSNGTPTGPLGLAMPEPSPSFQGDEIDAIFHEMAHLDTNEWTSERALGLRDFGFSDDLTFQAFCNDPERLIAPGEGLQQALSSNSQTWTFAGPNTGLT